MPRGTAPFGWNLTRALYWNLSLSFAERVRPLPLKRPARYSNLLLPRTPQTETPVSRPRKYAFETSERSTSCWLPEETSSCRPNGTLYWPSLTMNCFLPLVTSQLMFASSR